MSPVCKTIGSLPPGDRQEGICTDILKGRYDSIQVRGVCLMEGRLCRKTQAQVQCSRSSMQSIYARLPPAAQACPTMGTCAQPREQQLRHCTNSLKLQSYQVAGIDFFFTRNNSILSGICLYITVQTLRVQGKGGFQPSPQVLSKIDVPAARRQKSFATQLIVQLSPNQWLRHILVFWLLLFITKFKMLQL